MLETCSGAAKLRARVTAGDRPLAQLLGVIPDLYCSTGLTIAFPSNLLVLSI